jgi:hypothetical protein
MNKYLTKLVNQQRRGLEPRVESRGLPYSNYRICCGCFPLSQRQQYLNICFSAGLKNLLYTTSLSPVTFDPGTKWRTLLRNLNLPYHRKLE